ncbi:hypothetical protein ACFQ0M_09215 [Kitasatospora aburaviensis]
MGGRRGAASARGPAAARHLGAGRRAHPAARPLALLAAACPQYSWEQLAGAPLGRLAGLLAALRRALVGDAVEAVACCPACNGLVEVGFALSGVYPQGGPVPVAAAELLVSADGHEVRCRPVTTADVLAVRGAADPAAALLARCVTAAARVAVPEDDGAGGARARAAVVRWPPVSCP